MNVIRDAVVVGEPRTRLEAVEGAEVVQALDLEERKRNEKPFSTSVNTLASKSASSSPAVEKVSNAD